MDSHQILLVHALDTSPENYKLQLVCSIFYIWNVFMTE